MSRWIVLVLAAVALAGCERDRARGPGTAEPSTGIQGGPQSGEEASATTQPAKLSDHDRDFIHKAAMGGLAEVQLGQLALRQAEDAQVKDLARTLVDDHSKVNQQLMELAEKKGVDVSRNLDREHRSRVDNLAKRSGREFETAFVNEAIQDHQKDLELFQNEAQNGQDPDLKALAEKTVPTLREHLRKAQDLQRQLSTGGGATTMPATEEETATQPS